MTHDAEAKRRQAIEKALFPLQLTMSEEAWHGMVEVVVYLVTTQVAEAQRLTRIETLSDAVDRGYLDHRDDCRKGIDSETCTCGIMSWIPKDQAPRLDHDRS